MARQYQKQRVTRIEYKCTTLCDICKAPIVNNDPYREDEVTTVSCENYLTTPIFTTREIVGANAPLRSWTANEVSIWHAM